MPITSGNLNSYTTPGKYKVQTYGIASDISNMPEISAGKLIVEHSNGANNIIQTYKTTTGNIWIRCYTNNAWTTWVCNATKSDLESQLKFGGDTKYIRSAFVHSDGVGNIRFGSDDSNYIYLDITSTGIALKKCTNGEVVTVWTK